MKISISTGTLEQRFGVRKMFQLMKAAGIKYTHKKRTHIVRPQITDKAYFKHEIGFVFCKEIVKM